MFCRYPSTSGGYEGSLTAEGGAGTFLVKGWIPWKPGCPADGNANLPNALLQPLPATLLLIKRNLIMQITHPTLTQRHLFAAGTGCIFPTANSPATFQSSQASR